MELDEFHIASNPPLTPSGVREVIEQLRVLQLEKFIHIYEVVYDPEVPWFRILAQLGARQEITQFVKGLLTKFGEEDATAVDKDENRSHADIETADESRLTAWSPSKLVVSRGDFDTFRFPKFRAEAESENNQDSTDLSDLSRLDNNPKADIEPPFKAAWRGLEEHWPQFTSVEQFLSCLHLPTVAHQGLSNLEKLQQYFGVEISWNFRATIIYIASFGGMTQIKKTIKLLDQTLRNELKQHQTKGQLNENAHDNIAEEVFW